MGLFSLTERALDSQPLAIGGGFTLVREEVVINTWPTLAFNIPVFEEHGSRLQSQWTSNALRLASS